MRILSVSDFTVPELTDRFDRERFGRIDTLLACGDLQPRYLLSLVRKFGVPLYYVMGNHDLNYDSVSLYGCTNLDNSIVKVQGLNFLGLEGSNWYNGGINQYTDRQMRLKILNLTMKIWMKGGVDIVATHAPPRNVHDAEDQCHRGFESFHKLIRKHSPKYLVHGHTHAHFSDPSERVTRIGRTDVVNTCGYHILEVDNEHNR